MTEPPTPSAAPTDATLHVLRTLGVTDAALRRHLDVGPGASLRAAIDASSGRSPTDDLLAALAATGRVLDLRDGLDPADGDRLTAALARFGFVVRCSAAGDGVEVVVLDAVEGSVRQFRTAADSDDAREALHREVLAPAGIEALELLDGRLLLAEAAELAVLTDRYGRRIAPFETPLLTDAAAEAAARATADRAGGGERGAADHADDFGEALAEADAETTAALEAALAASGPQTHTIDDGAADVDAEATTVGGGPTRRVSTSGIDEVFAAMEQSAGAEEPDSEVATPTDPPAPSTDADTDADTDSDRTMPEPTTALDDPDPTDDAETDGDAESDGDETKDAEPTGEGAPGDAMTGSDDAGAESGGLAGLSGGPTRTVSSTSADDILARATGRDDDFEAIAAEHEGPDPDAVLAEGDGVPPGVDLDEAEETESDGPVAGEPAKTTATEPTDEAQATDREDASEVAARSVDAGADPAVIDGTADDAEPSQDDGGNAEADDQVDAADAESVDADVESVDAGAGPVDAEADGPSVDRPNADELGVEESSVDEPSVDDLIAAAEADFAGTAEHSESTSGTTPPAAERTPADRAARDARRGTAGDEGLGTGGEENSSAEGSTGLGDDLVGEDGELSQGTESVEHATPIREAEATDRSDDERSATDDGHGDDEDDDGRGFLERVVPFYGG